MFLLSNNWQFLNNWKTLSDCKRTNFNNIKGYIECINTCVKLDNDLNIKAPDHRIRKLSLKFAGVIDQLISQKKLKKQFGRRQSHRFEILGNYPSSDWPKL